MKCIKMNENGVVMRVKDAHAQELVEQKKLAVYVPKSEWKKLRNKGA